MVGRKHIRPLDASRSVSSLPCALVLSVEDGFLALLLAPVEPSGGDDLVGDVATDEHNPGVSPPSTAQVDGTGPGDGASDERESAGQVVWAPLLGGDGSAVRLGDGVDAAALVDGLAVSEDEVDGSLHEAVLEVVTACLVVEGVLRSVERAAVESAVVSLDSQCDGLLSDSSTGWCRCRVLHTTTSNTQFRLNAKAFQNWQIHRIDVTLHSALCSKFQSSDSEFHSFQLSMFK